MRGLRRREAYLCLPFSLIDPVRCTRLVTLFYRFTTLTETGRSLLCISLVTGVSVLLQARLAFLLLLWLRVDTASRKFPSASRLITVEVG
jgi:hypothetical protein